MILYFTKFNSIKIVVRLPMVTFVDLIKMTVMLNTNIDYAQFPGCPIRNVLSRIGDKWSMLVLYTLDKYGVLRFKDLMLYIPDISKKMLSTALKVLEADGLVARKIYAEVPPRVEYRLTERGMTLIPLLNNLMEWAVSNMDDILEDRERFVTDE